MAVNKLMSLKEAVSKYINDGDTIYYGGFQIMVPMAGGWPEPEKLIEDASLRVVEILMGFPDVICCRWRAQSERPFISACGNSELGHLLELVDVFGNLTWGRVNRQASDAE